mmetsp:Transcript_16901/g.39036  ORF Transcript_16901/g.39036 Transcript_16901/m.39036 type:complete len:458 (-) Transcript_16901:120-1493(-)|eukprot:CAMPEP_0197192030 /NCGR_PEP_ID=MMETSP1423-20130617/24426_1 /TAXON_ID=476441 /ORGANISM="Pseudo-nitzschia heimii, Strain UNC1101" /LENGTH=457 /DNA_ID=CAMNT_0042644841 /DNA_START=193 /DNA_END=1566 /DNA_ORIENTATION=+
MANQVCQTSPQSGEDFSQCWLNIIAESKNLCHQAQCHYLRASNFAVDQPNQKEDLLVALRETHLGYDKLTKSFMCIRTSPMLNYNFPVLTSQIRSVTHSELERFDIRSSDLFSESGSIEEKQHATRERNVSKHRGSLLRFINRCHEITTHQRRLLEAVECQIQAENLSVGRAEHRVDLGKQQFPYNSQNLPLCQYQQDHAMIDLSYTSRNAEAESITDQIISTLNLTKNEQCQTKIAAGASMGRNDEYSHQYDSNQDPVFRAKSDKATDKSTDDEFEPLSINTGSNAWIEEDDLAKAHTIASSIAQTSAVFTPDMIFPNSKPKTYSYADATPNSGINATKIAASVSRRGRRKASHSSLPRSKGRGTGSNLKQQHRRPPRNFKKSKGDRKSASPLPLSSSSEHDLCLSLALGGRMDFMNNDSTFGKGILHSLEKDIGSSDTDGNNGSAMGRRSSSQHF